MRCVIWMVRMDVCVRVEVLFYIYIYGKNSTNHTDNTNVLFLVLSEKTRHVIDRAEKRKFRKIFAWVKLK